MQERLASKEDVFLVLSEEDKQRQGASLEGWIQLTRRKPHQKCSYDGQISGPGEVASAEPMNPM